MTHTATVQIAQVPKNPSPERTPEWLYNEIMRHVLPDLMTDHLPLLELKYAGESEMEKASRRSAYEEAFRVFDAVAKDITLPIVEAGRGVLRTLRAAHARDESAQAAEDLRSAEDSLSAV